MADRRRWVTDVALGFPVGIYSGLFGVGAGVVAVPALVWWGGLQQKAAQATSLVAIGVTAIAGTISFGLDGQVAWSAAGILATTGVLATVGGTRLVKRVPTRALTITFATVLLLIAAWFLFGPQLETDTATTQAISWSDAAIFGVIGLAAGMLSALMGVGGGVVIIPALAFFAGFNQHLAEGTSLAAIVPIALAGAVQLTPVGYTNWLRGIRIGATGLLGAPIGAALALSLDGVWLRRAFSALLILAALRLYSQLRSGGGNSPESDARYLGWTPLTKTRTSAPSSA